ncbi:hypothetical protein [Streptomyces sp. NPDC019507]|uniref:hypothetical protein n=1 Tax=Streptomyces sp. NPDC019507 TaxID=3154689 RepID=UPI00340243CB
MVWPFPEIGVEAARHVVQAVAVRAEEQGGLIGGARLQDHLAGEQEFAGAEQ